MPVRGCNATCAGFKVQLLSIGNTRDDYIALNMGGVSLTTGLYMPNNAPQTMLACMSEQNTEWLNSLMLLSQYWERVGLGKWVMKTGFKLDSFWFFIRALKV